MTTKSKKTFSNKSRESKAKRKELTFKEMRFCCSFCDFSCKSPIDLTHHEQILHKDKSLFSCSFCYYSCEKPALLSLHMLLHSGECKFSCAQCNMKFHHMYYLKKHLRNHICAPSQGKKGKFVCSVCCKTFCWKINYTKHVIKHRHVSVYRCLWCDFSTREMSNLCDHRYTHLTDKGYVCLECSQAFSSVTEHEVHMLLYHEKKYIDSTSNEQVFPCTLCDQIFPKIQDLKVHVISTHSSECSFDLKDIKVNQIQKSNPERKYLCSTCGAFLCTAGTLKAHKCKMSQNKTFTCSTCQHTFPTRAQLRSHEYVHSGQRPFSCIKCSYKCRRMQYLKRHMLIHSGEKTHLCTVCGQSFIFPETLKRHMHKHAFEQPFSCNVCSFTTSDPSNLTRHMVKHIRNFFSCDFCSYSCIRAADMDKHKQTHVQGDQISCSACSLTFVTSKELQAHMLTHLSQSDANYMCQFCSFNCQVQKEYIQHMKTHSIDRPFACTVCDYCSNRRMNLKVHMRKQHDLSLASVVSFICKICHFTCERDQDYIKHMLISHKVDKPYDCPVCPFATHRQGLLKAHMETHKPHGFFCHLCNFKSKRKTLLNKHLITKHFNNNRNENETSANERKVYTCQHCEFVSKHYASLRNHIAVHSSVRFPCDECSYVTYSQRNLASHKRSHVKDKPFKCPFCDYASARKNNFKLHMVRHKDEKLYYCDKCDFISKCQLDLTGHVEASHGEKSAPSDPSANVITIFQTNNQTIVYGTEPTYNSFQKTADSQTCPPKSNMLEKSNIKSHEYNNSSHTYTGYIRLDSVVQSSDPEQVSPECHSIHIQGHSDLPQSNTIFPEISVTELSSYQQLKQVPSLPPPKEDICQFPHNSEDYTEKQTVDNVQQLPPSHIFPSVAASINHHPSGTFHNSTNAALLPTSQIVNNNMSSAETGAVVSLHDMQQCEMFQSFQHCSLPFHDVAVRDTIMSVQPQAIQSQTSQVQVLPYDSPAKNIRDFSQNVTFMWDGQHYACSLCTFQCSNEQDLSQHSAFHSVATSQNTAVLTCSTCTLFFNTLEDLNRHRLQYHFEPDSHFQQDIPETCEVPAPNPKICTNVAREKVYKCSHCSFEYSRPSDFKRHMLSQHGIEKAFSCQLCAYSTKREDDLRTHAITHDENMIRSCSVCDYTCKRLPALRKHMRKHTDIRLFSCNLCSFWCNYEPDLKSHVLNVHERPKHFTCDLCLFTSDFAIHFKKHMLTVHAVENAFKCPHCDYSTTLWNNFRAHRLKHSNTKKYICQVCNHLFKRSSSLKHHMYTHSNNKSLSCSHCDYHCNLFEKLKIHMRRHTNEQPYICRFCQRSYTHSSSLYKHISLVHKNSKRHLCSMCPYATCTLSFLKRHMLTHGVGKCFDCNVCHFTCNHKEVLENHMLLHSSSIGTNDTNGKGSACSTSEAHSAGSLFSEKTQFSSSTHPSKWTCSSCNYTFSSTSNFKKHMLRHKRLRHVNKFTCSVCDFSCLRPFELKIHTCIHTGEKPFSCDSCDFVCSKPYTLKYHKERKHRENGDTKYESSVTCSVCHFSCSKRIHLKNHMLEKHQDSDSARKRRDPPVSDTITLMNKISLSPHIQASPTIENKEYIKVAQATTCNPKERLFVCDLCNYSSWSKGNLMTHMQRHQSKQFLCHLCDYMCHRERELMRHLLIHEDGKPLSCRLCSYTCIQPASLKVHMLRHKEEKPIHCKLCSFRCRQSSTLRDHMTTHSDERKYSCDLCDYKAKRAISLKMHKFTHSSERPVSCTLCDFNCKHANALRSHMRSHAKDHLT